MGPGGSVTHGRFVTHGVCPRAVKFSGAREVSDSDARGAAPELSCLVGPGVWDVRGVSQSCQVSAGLVIQRGPGRQPASGGLLRDLGLNGALGGQLPRIPLGPRSRCQVFDFVKDVP